MSKRIRTHVNPLSFYQKLMPLNFDDIFHNFDGSLQLEIGFGKGVFISKYAQLYPNSNLLAVDVRKGLFEPLQEQFDQENIQNVHLIHGTGERVLDELIPHRSLSRVFLFHPDPWFKKRHINRRVIQPEFLGLLKQKLSDDGRFYVSTDVELLWEYMSDILLEAGFTKVEDSFWTTDYTSHWSMFSEKDLRTQYYSAWQYSL